MNVRFKARAFARELAIELQVLDDLLVEHFAGNEQRNARWIRRHQTCGDAAFQLINGHALCGALRDTCKGVAGLHGWRVIAQIHVGGQDRHIVFGIETMHMLAQVA